MGFPFTMFEQFLDWEWNILHEDAIEKKAEALRGVLAYLRGFIADKQADPDDTLGSYIANGRSEEHTSELQSLMRISYAVFCLKKKKHQETNTIEDHTNKNTEPQHQLPSLHAYT